MLWRLIEGADVLVENYRRDTLEKLGFSYELARARNPRLVWCAISGFGRTGPYARRGGFDLVAQAMSGIMSITGTRRGDPPVKCGAPLTDITAGLLAAIGILAALAERGRSGQGQLVDTSLYEAGIVHTYWQSAIALATGTAPGPMGSAHPLSAPYQAFATSDGWLVVGGANQSVWRRLLEVLAAPEIALDPRFRENKDRMAHLAELDRGALPALPKKTTAEWLALLERAGVPAGPVQDVNAMHADPQTLAREMVVEVQHSRLAPSARWACRSSCRARPGDRGTARRSMASSRARCWASFGYAATEIEALVASGAVRGPEAA